MLKFIYSLFLGLLVATFVGMGVATFYPEPTAPVYPRSAVDLYVEPVDKKSPQYQEMQGALDKYEASNMTYADQLKQYNRNVALFTVIAAVALLALGLSLAAHMSVIADGLLLGGTFTLLYSVIRSLVSNDSKYAFVIVGVAVLVTMVVGYLKFIKPHAVPAKASRKK